MVSLLKSTKSYRYKVCRPRDAAALASCGYVIMCGSDAKARRYGLDVVRRCETLAEAVAVAVMMKEA